MITTGNTSNKGWADGRKPTGWDAYLDQVIRPRMAAAGIRLTEAVSDAAPLQASINHGRWLVKCECNGAELAWEEGLFMCLSCFNAGHGHELRRAGFPVERRAIETLLERRAVENQNWQPEESLTFLEAENVAHKEVLL